MTAAIGATHLAAHLLILVGYVAAMVAVPSALRSLIHVRTLTWVSGAGFFLFCGITHLGNALGEQLSWWVSVTDHLQATAILTFIPCLWLDLRDALGRFQTILDEVAHPTVGRRIAAALQNAPGWDDPDHSQPEDARPELWNP